MKKFTIFYVFIILGLYSCEKIIDMDIKDTDRKIVINGVFTDQAPVVVHISKSMHILDNDDFQCINNANVKIFRNNELIDTLLLIDDGIYSLEGIYPDIGAEYTIEVGTGSFPTARGSNIIPEPVPVISIDTQTVEHSSTDIFGDSYTEMVLDCSIRFNDPPETKNYYILNISVRDNYTDEEYFVDFDSDDIIIEEWLTRSYGVLFSDDRINGNTYEFGLYMYSYYFSYQDTTNMIIYLNSISEDYYKYSISYLRHQEAKENPFAEPVQVYNNISNGYGIFAGFSSSSDTLKLFGYSNYE